MVEYQLSCAKAVLAHARVWQETILEARIPVKHQRESLTNIKSCGSLRDSLDLVARAHFLGVGEYHNEPACLSRVSL